MNKPGFEFLIKWTKFIKQNTLMKHYFRLIVMFTLPVLFLMLLPALLHAQPDPGGDPDAPIPIDGGLGVLLAAGVGYGIKKMRDHRKSKNSNTTL